MQEVKSIGWDYLKEKRLWKELSIGQFIFQNQKKLLIVKNQILFCNNVAIIQLQDTSGETRRYAKKKYMKIQVASMAYKSMASEEHK